MLKPAVANFIYALIAVLAGNAVYFLLMPHLPLRVRHVPLQIDLGLLVDFCFCLLLFEALKTVSRWKNRPNSQKN